MGSTLEDYRAGRTPIPETMLAWQITGKGMENVGENGRPQRIPVPRFADDELLARVDANGLCFSDIKIINLGSEHPRLRGRDLKANPVIPGHEVALTIVGVGENLRDRFRVGDRFLVQADIYYKGVNYAFGYALAGGLAQYVVIGKEILEGDEGCYLLPLKPETGYAEAGLSEPWACVERAYRAAPRMGLREGGTLCVIVAEQTAERQFSLGEVIEAGPAPRVVVLLGPSGAAEQLFQRAAQRWGAGFCAVREGEVKQLAEQHAGGAFDDVIVLGPADPRLISAAGQCLARDGVVNIVADEPLSAPVEVDAGRIHYENFFYIGSRGPDISESYRRTRNAEIVPGGLLWVVGAGGPMGQMHVQRALELPQPPQLVVATDIDQARLDSLAERMGEIAARRNIALRCLNPQALGEEEFSRRLRALAPEGFDDVVLLVPSPALICECFRWLRARGVLNIFAGVQRGTLAPLDLSRIFLEDVRVVGTSGSSISDLQYTLSKTESGQLSPNLSVAAIGGIDAALDGLKAVRDGLFPGKIVIYPQVEGLPLTPLDRLGEVLPSVAAKLGPRHSWTNEAEQELLRIFIEERNDGR